MRRATAALREAATELVFAMSVMDERTAGMSDVCLAVQVLELQLAAEVETMRQRR
jgi:hypothetical protein